MTAMKWFLSFLKKYSGLMILGLILTTIIAALSIVNPYISGVIVDDVITAGNYNLLPALVACLFRWKQGRLDFRKFPLPFWLAPPALPFSPSSAPPGIPTSYKNSSAFCSSSPASGNCCISQRNGKLLFSAVGANLPLWGRWQKSLIFDG